MRSTKSDICHVHDRQILEKDYYYRDLSKLRSVNSIIIDIDLSIRTNTYNFLNSNMNEKIIMISLLSNHVHTTNGLLSLSVVLPLG